MASINLLSMCVWSQTRFLWFEPIYSAGCLPQFKSFWLKNSEYRIQRLKHWRTSFCPSELFRNSHFIVAQFFKKKKKSLAEWGMFHCIKICVRFQQDFLCICNSGLLCDVVDPGVIMRVWGGRRGKALYLNTGIETHTPHAPPSGEKTRLTEKWINIEENAWDLVADFRSRSGDTCLFRNLCLSRAWERLKRLCDLH